MEQTGGQTVCREVPGVNATPELSAADWQCRPKSNIRMLNAGRSSFRGSVCAVEHMKGRPNEWRMVIWLLLLNCLEDGICDRGGAGGGEIGRNGERGQVSGNGTGICVILFIANDPGAPICGSTERGLQQFHGLCPATWANQFCFFVKTKNG